MVVAQLPLFFIGIFIYISVMQNRSKYCKSAS